MKIDKCRAYESLLRGETEHQQLFNALSDQSDNSKSTEYASPRSCRRANRQIA